MKIRQCFLELQLKMSGMFFFETHCIYPIHCIDIAVYVLILYCAIWSYDHNTE